VAAKKAPPASDLPKLAAPAQRALAGAGVTNLSKLSRMTEADVMALHGMGPNAMTSLKTAMKASKLGFAKP
jgi:predicted Fe-Mo cluster-binding NifX family protein